MQSEQRTVAIIEGFAGGPKGTKDFRRALAKADFELIKDKVKADIVIAHSAGCYNIPKNNRANLLVLLGPPYWPSQPLRGRFIKNIKVMKDYQVSQFGWQYYLKRKLVELYYVLTKPKILWLALTKHKDLEFIEGLTGKIVLVRNKEDLYCSPEIIEAVGNNVSYVELPGNHDDFVTNPEPYIKLIQSEYDRG